MAPKKETPQILKAVEFVSVAQRDKGTPYQVHLTIKDKYAVAYDGVLFAGHPVDFELSACPHTFTLLQALKRCNGAMAMTQTAQDRLVIKAGKFKAAVPCLDIDDIPPMRPDPQVGVVTPELLTAFAVVAPLISETSQRVVTASALLKSGSITGTNGTLIVEYWHGIDMPPDLVLPKLFLSAAIKAKKEVVGFGFSATTFTLHYADGSWLKTQLYIDKWPDCSALFARPYTLSPIPNGLYTGVDAIAAFATDNVVHFTDGAVRTHIVGETGASYNVPKLQADFKVNAKNIGFMSAMNVDQLDFVGCKNASYFTGKSLRGLLMHIVD
jgi:hypothetical protein